MNIVLLTAILASLVSKIICDDVIEWTCIDIQSSTLVDGVTWKTENCSMSADEAPLLTVNSVTVDLTNKNIRVVPGVPSDDADLQTIPEMASQNENFLAGINGGYFWRVDIDGIWIDDVCRGKTRFEANQPVNSRHVNFGVGDGLIKIDGEVMSNNCNCTGFSRPATLELNGQKSTIEVLYRGDTVSKTVRNAISAGPNLVSYDDSTGESFIDIPSDDDNINILEHAANTAVGLLLSEGIPVNLIMVTTDGSDECGPKDNTCGLNSKNLASLMKDKFNCGQAMSMDQGGSTTMWVKGANPDRNGVVSRSHNTEPVEQDGPRNVANGLFVEILS